MSAIERGESNPTYSSLIAIAQTLHLRLSQLREAVEAIGTAAPDARRARPHEWIHEPARRRERRGLVRR